MQQYLMGKNACRIPLLSGLCLWKFKSVLRSYIVRQEIWGQRFEESGLQCFSGFIVCACNKQHGVKQLCLFSCWNRRLPRHPGDQTVLGSTRTGRLHLFSSSSSLCGDVLHLFSAEILNFNEHFYLRWSKQQMLAVKSGGVGGSKIVLVFNVNTWRSLWRSKVLICPGQEGWNLSLGQDLMLSVAVYRVETLP